MYLWLMIPLAILPVLMLVGGVVIWRKYLSGDVRRSPLQGKRTHLPGEQLQERIDNLGDDAAGYLIGMMVIGPFLFSGWLVTLIKPENLPTFSLTFGNVAFVLAFLAFFAVCAYKLVQILKALRQARDGRAAELATAQHLMPLMAKGCQIFHDVPGDKFNLDHVVVAPHAVFMVEAKSRRKPAGKGKASASIEYDGQRLSFPGWQETKPLEQARYQARWLSDYLKGTTGESVPVVPVVALPGWFVNLGKDAHRSDVKVLNPKYHAPFMDTRNPAMAESLRNRIAYALSQRYPDFD